MSIFYRGPGVHITHEVFEVRRPVCESFPIRELTSVHVAQEQGNVFAAGSGLARFGTTALAVVAIPVAVIGWQVVDSAGVVIIALLVSTISSVVSVGCWRGQDYPFELWATFRGRPICLFRTRDARELGQVRRALLRALERYGTRWEE